MLQILISVEYGAEECYWLAPFDCYEDVLAWWLDLEHADIYVQQPPSALHVLTFGKVVSRPPNDIEFYNRRKFPLTIMLENDHSSYLFWQGKQHHHRGFLKKS